MSVPIPVILSPTSEPAFSTNLEMLTIGGTYDMGVTSILVNGSTGGVSISGDISGGIWSFTTQLVEGENDFSVQASDGTSLSGADDLIVIFSPELDSTLLAQIPSGFRIRQGRNIVTISAPVPDNPNFIGFNFYGSEDAGGGVQGYTLLTSSPLSQVTFFEDQETLISEEVSFVGPQRTTVTVEQILRVNFVSFDHDRLNNPIGTKPITEKNYYVITTVIFDPLNKQLVESGYSEELAAKPVVIDTTLKEIDARTEGDFRLSIIDQILQSDNTIDMKPGTVFRDTIIDPNSQMFSRLFTILRFMNISQSFPALLKFDDPTNSGVSSEVLTDQNKNALREALLIPTTSATQVQDLIDAAFDKLAGNVNVTRLPARQAIGQIIVYTKRTPDRDVEVQVGAFCETLQDDVNKIASVQFEVLSGFVLRVADLAEFFNPSTGRYEFTLPIRAVEAGLTGNVDSGKIVSTVSGFDSIFGVTNSDPTEFGSDRESNSNLATRAELAFLSVDSGTEAGLFSRTLAVQGVTRAKVIKAKDPLMQRDLDPIREIHSLGKVDIYVQGASNREITETLGFSYKKVTNEPFFIQSRVFYQFNTTNPEVDADHAIFEVQEVRNLTRNSSYDLTGLVISNDGNLIDLDENLPSNILIGLGTNDVIRVTYRFRKADRIQLSVQPVESITSVTGSKSGELSSANFRIFHQDDPLALGHSTAARDQIEFIFADGLPNAQREVILDEPIVLISTIESPLSFVDVDVSTIVVKRQSDSLVLLENLDYEIDPGDAKTATTIRRVTGGNIPDGSTVLVSYDAGEVMTVTYEVNSILTDVQSQIDEIRHVTADIITKSAQPTKIDIDMTVSLDSGADAITVNRNIRTSIGNFFAAAKLGQNIYQSDIISLVEQVPGVNFLVVPLTKMVKQDGTQVHREVLTNPQFVPFVNAAVQSYRSTETLSSNTVATGGPDNEFRSIFENDFPLTMVTVDTDVASASGQGYIAADGHIIVSTRHGTDPNASTFSVTYIVEGDTGSNDIDLSGIEYPAIGTLKITFAQTGQSFTT